MSEKKIRKERKTKMRYHNLEFDMILRGIIMTRGDEGATISELRSDYLKMVGEIWPLNRTKTDQIIQYLMEIDGLMMEKEDNGLCIWYIDDIGSSISREFDSNNNVIVIEESTVESTTSNQPASNSYVIPAPKRRMVNSSFVSETHARQVSAVSSDILHIEPFENGNGNKNRKRNVSHDQIHNTNIKRQKLTPNTLLLNEQNLDIHNRKNGPNLMAKTSTEIENSLSIQDDIDGNEYVAPMKETASKQLQQ